MLKADFLVGMNPGFSLVETLYATRAHGVRYFRRHWRRLRCAAYRFHFVWPARRLVEALKQCLATLPSDAPYKIRVTLDKEGKVEIVHTLLLPLRTMPVDILLASGEGFVATLPDDPLCRYKTTYRVHYDRALRVARQRGAFDMLFFNTRGELTEGARSNVFVKLDGRWWTPPVSSGLLPGVMRGVLLDTPGLQVTERVLTRADVCRAAAIMVCNALRGAVPARLVL